MLCSSFRQRSSAAPDNWVNSHRHEYGASAETFSSRRQSLWRGNLRPAAAQSQSARELAANARHVLVPSSSVEAAISTQWGAEPSRADAKATFEHSPVPSSRPHWGSKTLTNAIANRPRQGAMATILAEADPGLRGKQLMWVAQADTAQNCEVAEETRGALGRSRHGEGERGGTEIAVAVVMKKRSSWGKLGGLMLVLPLVPAFFMIEHVGTEGFPEALGCSGSGSNGAAALAIVTVVGAVGNQPLSVATDGFVLLDVYGAGAGGPLADLVVEVKTSAGDVVPGSLKMVAETSFVGWQPDAPLAVGAKLSIVAKLKSYPASVTIQLEVVGTPTELSADTLMFENWLTFGHGVGAPTTCTNMSGGSCSSGQPLTVFGSEEQLRAVRASWQTPQVNGTVAWQARLELAGGAPLIAPTRAQSLFRTSSDAAELGTLVFPKDATEYCAELVVKDLRTGNEQRSKLCAEPQLPSGTERDYPLEYCGEPPTPALKQAWCETNSSNPLCGGSPEDPMPQDPDPNVPGDDIARAPNTSAGCQMPRGVPATSASALLLALGGLAAAWQRTKRARRR